MENKRGQGLSINMIILIILGIIVLVAVILGFATGWKPLKDLISPSNNVGDIASKCQIACATDQKFNYCFEKRNLKTDEDDLKGTSCYTLTKNSDYGIEDCLGIKCGIYDDNNADNEKLSRFCEKNEGESFYYIENLDTLKLKESSC